MTTISGTVIQPATEARQSWVPTIVIALGARCWALRQQRRGPEDAKQISGEY